MWLGWHKKNIQVALFPLRSSNEIGRLIKGKISERTKVREKKYNSCCEGESLLVKIDVVIFLFYSVEKVLFNSMFNRI